MKARGTITGAGLALALAGCGSAASVSTPATTAPAQPAATTTTAPPPSPAHVTGQGTCNVSLSTDAYGQDYLTATISVSNDGGQGATVVARVSWPLQGFSPLTASKTVAVPAGASDQPVEFNKPVSTDQVSEFQNEQLGPQGQQPGGPCTYSLTQQ
jgi:hypothetical protein